MGGERLPNRLPEAKESRRVAAVNSPSPFGQNEWLVEEMYRKFREEPSSVDPSWHEFLSDYSPEPTTDSQATGGNGQQAHAPVAPPEPAPAPPPKAAESKSVPAPAPKAQNKAGDKAEKKAEDNPEVAPAKPKQSPSPAPAAGSEVRVLRGAAAAVVKNMSASLEVPTATSVRAIPAKLLIDNRVVINNHLKRTRGGKISFTHLIGYALVQAVKAFPNMNRHFAEIDGKPNVITPASTNLGLAIDLPGKNGSRS